MNPNEINDDFVRRAKEELEKLETRRKALLNFLSTYDNSKEGQLSFFVSHPSEEEFNEETGNTIRERIIGVIKTLVEKRKGKSVRITDVVDYIKKNKIDMGSSAKPRNLISSILSTEVHKPNGVLKKVRRGMYNFR